MFRGASMVTTIPPLMIRSTDCFDCADAAAQIKTTAAQTSIRSIVLINPRILVILSEEKNPYTTMLLASNGPGSLIGVRVTDHEPHTAEVKYPSSPRPPIPHPAPAGSGIRRSREHSTNEKWGHLP